MNNPQILLCACNSTEHQMVILKETDLLYGSECYVHIHLVNHKPFWKRLKYAVKYLFGYKCRFGAWDEFILDPKHVESLQDVINHLTLNDTQRITV